MLRDEISESQIRLKFVKSGQSLNEIVPYHKSTFYLPRKEHFKIAQSMHLKNRQFLQSHQQSLASETSSNVQSPRQIRTTVKTRDERNDFCKQQDSMFITE